MSSGPQLALVGSFTTARRQARGRGIAVYRLGAGRWREAGEPLALDNPSWLLASKDGRTVFAVHGDGRHVTALRVERDDGLLSPINRVPSGGLNGVHGALDPTGRFLLVANHDSGSLAVLPVASDGALGEPVQIVRLMGEIGPRPEQTSAQPHQIVFDPAGNFVLVPAKGLDRVLVYDFDSEQGQLALRETGHLTMPAGAGPRHLAFHPGLDVLFVVNEIDSALALCSWAADSGAIALLQLTATLPQDGNPANTASAILVSGDGRDIYVSNRGHDSIGHLRFDQAEMRLAPVGWTPANGACPRFMCRDPAGEDIFVAAEQSDCISRLSRDPVTGRLSFAGVVADCPSPSCVLFV